MRRRQEIRYGPQQRRTSLWVWTTAVICAILAFAVVVIGLVIFVGYMIIRPKLPYITVTYAHLESLYYDQYGQMDTQISLGITATNDNAKAHASFDNVSFLLWFHGVLIARLRAEPFEVPKNSSLTLPYSVPSSMVPLDEGAREEIGASLQQGRVSFLLKGDARTRWKVGILGSVRFWSHLSCNLNFATANGSSINLDCSSKSH